MRSCSASVLIEEHAQQRERIVCQDGAASLRRSDRSPLEGSMSRPVISDRCRAVAPVVLAVGLAAGSCAAPAETATPPTSPTSAAPGSSSSSIVPSKPGGQGLPMRLRDDGLAETDFGAPQPAALAALTAALGPPANTSTLNAAPSGDASCTERTTAYWLRAGVNATFQHGTFDGWLVTGEGPATAGHVGVGATVAVARAEFGSRLHFAGSRALPVGQDRDGTGDADKIRLLWGGVDCGAR
jgi:hypothetical protein